MKFYELNFDKLIISFIYNKKTLREKFNKEYETFDKSLNIRVISIYVYNACSWYIIIVYMPRYISGAFQL